MTTTPTDQPSDWRAEAACRGSDVDFVPKQPLPKRETPGRPLGPKMRAYWLRRHRREMAAYRAEIERALDICQRCPVREPCLQAALAEPALGVWVAPSSKTDTTRSPSPGCGWAGTFPEQHALVAPIRSHRSRLAGRRQLSVTFPAFFVILS